MASKVELRHHLAISGEKEYTAGMQAAGAAMKKTASEQALLNAKYGEGDKSLAKMASQQDLLQRKLTAQQQKLETVRKALDKATQSGGKNSNLAKELSREYDYAQAAILKTERELSTLNQEMNAATSRTSQLKSKLKELGVTGESVGKKLDTMGKTLTKSLTVPILGGMVTSTKLFMDFEDQMTTFATIADTSKKSLAELSAEALQASSATGVAAKDVSAAMYQAVSANIATEKSSMFVTQSAKAAKAGLSDVTTVVDGATSAMNAWGIATEDATEVYDKMIVAQNLGKVTLGDLAQQMGQVTGFAPQLGVSLDEVLGAVAALTRNGVQSASAFTGLKAAMAGVIKPTEQARKEAKRLKLDFSADAMREKGLTGFLADVMAKTKGSEESLAQLFGSVEGLSKIMALGTTAAGDYAEIMEAMGNSAGALESAFDTKMGSKAEQLSMGINKLKNNAISLGENAVPALDFVNAKLGELTDWLGNLTKEEQQQVIQMALILAAIGPVMSALGKGVTTVSKLSGAVKEFGSFIGKNGPLAIGVLAVGALVAGVVMLKNHLDSLKGVNQLKAAFGDITIDRTKLEDAVRAASGATVEDVIAHAKVRMNFTEEGDGIYASMEKYVNSKLRASYKDKKEFKAQTDAWVQPIYDAMAASVEEQREALRTKLANGEISQADFDTEMALIETNAEAAKTNFESLVNEYTTLVTKIAGSSKAATDEELAKLQSLREEIELTSQGILDANNKVLERSRISYEMVTSGYGNQIDMVQAAQYIQANRGYQRYDADQAYQAKQDATSADWSKAYEAGDSAGMEAVAAQIAADEAAYEAALADADASATEATNALYAGILAKYPEQAAALERMFENQSMIDSILGIGAEWDKAIEANSEIPEEIKASMAAIYEALTGQDATFGSESLQHAKLMEFVDSLSKESAQLIKDNDMTGIMTDFGIALQGGLLDGIDPAAISVELAAMLDAFTKTVEGSGYKDELQKDMDAAGVNSISAWVSGARSKQSSLIAVYREMGLAAAKAVKDALVIRSPSRVFRSMGINTIDAQIGGAKSRESALTQAYGRVEGKALTGAITGLQSRVAASNSLGMDVGALMARENASVRRQLGALSSGQRRATPAAAPSAPEPVTAGAGSGVSITVQYMGGVNSRDSRKLAQQLGGYLNQYNKR